MDNVELRKRQEYLRTQRDKLVALKKEARKNKLGADGGETAGATADSKPSRVRPKSAKAARALLSTPSPAAVEPQTLKLRKSLMERLKSEVMQNENN